MTVRRLARAGRVAVGAALQPARAHPLQTTYWSWLPRHVGLSLSQRSLTTEWVVWEEESGAACQTGRAPVRLPRLGGRSRARRSGEAARQALGSGSRPGSVWTISTSVQPACSSSLLRPSLLGLSYATAEALLISSGSVQVSA